MTDRDYEQRLRDWFREEDDHTRVAPVALRHGLIAIARDDGRGMSDSRRWMLLAAAALIALLVAGLAAVGSGLIRLPAPLPAALSLAGCRPTLADELVLSVGRERSGQTEVYRDGRVLASGWVTSPGGAPVDKILRQRRLRPEALADLLRSASDPGLKGCRDVPIDGADDLHVTVRDGGSVDEFHTGHGLYSVAPADPATTTAAAALYQRLMDRDLGVSADQWADGAWTEYQPDRYAVTVTLPTGVVPPTSGPWTIALPDGSNPVTFGAVMPDVSNGDYITRCGFVDPGEARAIRDAFERSPGRSTNAIPIPAANGGFIVPFFDLDPYSGLEARAALQHERSCTDIYPTPEKPVKGDAALASIDVCSLLEGGTMPDENGRQLGPFSGPGVAWEDTDTGASECDFANADTSIFYRIELRTQPTTAAAAEELVREAFGTGGYRQTEIAGRTTYLDACAYAALPCEPAIAISADPYYLVIRGTRQPTAEGTETVLRALAATAIERLGR